MHVSIYLDTYYIQACTQQKELETILIMIVENLFLAMVKQNLTILFLLC